VPQEPFGGDVPAFDLGARTPATNRQYWSAKISRNKQRDVEHIHAIRRGGWRVLTIWECEIKLPALMKRMTRFLDC